ncbi:unnamed protein product [Prorocentrum cordatum]|uniref:PDZ domain-containing protein n=1 Tax=Prorocentrum cordatum TaxID=2364126 RepID=A0ABN9SJ08_9DINO|nr:unnamed protein product [Polarella glacialis]
MGATCGRTGAADAEEVTAAGPQADPESRDTLGQVTEAAPPEALEADQAEAAELDQGLDLSSDSPLTQVSMASPPPRDVEANGLSFFPTPADARSDEEPYDREVTLTRPVKDGVAVGLGIGIRRVSRNTQLRIDDILDGVVKQWNENNPDNVIEKGFLIIQVNSARSSSAAMLEEMKSEVETLKLVVRRPSGNAARRKNHTRPTWSLEHVPVVKIDS